ncbi:hypothetical protein, partial [uncultured Dialister sp.]|uniref:hypothetical protein n=1 Tax=uncultured Dialister sp. TaxID=278064 RepID=UPI0026001069
MDRVHSGVFVLPVVLRDSLFVLREGDALRAQFWYGIPAAGHKNKTVPLSRTPIPNFSVRGLALFRRFSSLCPSPF